MKRLILLHTNDIHGRVDGIGRIATIVSEIRSAEADAAVVYVDAGDVEETSTWISNVTKGAAMHRLLAAAGCSVATVGNASWYRYGVGVLAEHAAAAGYPQLVANLHRLDGGQLPGTRSSSVVVVDGFRIGVIGVTATMGVESSHGIRPVSAVEVVRREARTLRAEGVDLVLVLSHLGLDVPAAAEDDRRLARALQREIDLIVGAHSHDLLPEGERIGNVLIAQAGEYAQHLGRIDVRDGSQRASVLSVPEDTPLHPAVLAAIEAIEPEVAAALDEVIGDLDRPLDAQWVAEMLRRRMGADVGLVTANQALSGTLPAGPVRRGELWVICDSSANPGVTAMSGAQLLQVIERGREEPFMKERPRAFRGLPRGLLHVAGPEHIDPKRSYLVAGTDWELEPYGGMVEESWRLDVRYDHPTIVREAIEEDLRG